MPTRVRVLYRVVPHVGVSVVVLPVEWVGDDRVGCDEPADGGVVVAGVVERQPTGLVEDLPGVEVVGVEVASVSLLTEWRVPLRTDRPVLIVGYGC